MIALYASIIVLAFCLFAFPCKALILYCEGNTQDAKESLFVGFWAVAMWFIIFTMMALRVYG